MIVGESVISDGDGGAFGVVDGDGIVMAGSTGLVLDSGCGCAEGGAVGGGVGDVGNGMVCWSCWRRWDSSSS